MFSNLTHNAINALMLVALHQRQGPVTTEFISRQLGLSISYLESLMSSLKKQSFVISYRGPGGGYCTLGKPGDIQILDVVKAFEVSATRHFETDSPAGELNKDIVSELVSDFVHQHLQGVSLEDVLSQAPSEHLRPITHAMHKPEPKPRFKPLRIHKLPTGPNSVFNLAQSMSL